MFGGGPVEVGFGLGRDPEVPTIASDHQPLQKRARPQRLRPGALARGELILTHWRR